MFSQIIHEKPENISADILVLGLHENDLELTPELQEMDKKMNGLIAGILSEAFFKGKEGETEILLTGGQINAKRLLLLGLGKQESLTGETLRKAAATSMQSAGKLKAATLAVMIPGKVQMTLEEVGRSLNEGVILGAYQFLGYKTDDETREKQSTVQTVLFNRAETMSADELAKGLESGRILGESVNMARDLVNEPPNVMDPQEFVRRARELAQHTGLEMKVLEREDMEKMKMGCILGVTSGSVRPPAMIVLRHNGAGDEAEDTIGLVGKGITFDSGGISLKPGEGMDEMKGDMAGAAAVLGAMAALARAKVQANVLAVIGLCENMPSGTAYRPGDILTSMNGKTVEVLNTDAEGRLVLADCVAYAQHLGATRLIDVATLTGACVIALGSHATGVVSNDDGWQQTLIDAGNATGEPCWPLPAFDGYAEQIKSDIADLKNIGGREGGAITAALFIRSFVEDKPWIHLDIAGTSYTKKPKVYQVKGGTGVAVRTLYRTVQAWIEKK
jgi:leucyl aminopeptidase